MPLPLINSEASFRVIEAQVEQAVKAGSLSREEAKKIIAEARESYRKQVYNRRIEAHNRVDKCL